MDTVAVVVGDRRKALAWYRDVLGLDAAYGPPEVGHWIEMGPARPRTRLHLCELDRATGPGPTGITIVTDNIRRDHERLLAKGVHLVRGPRLEEWGEWLCSFVDPDGNEFDLKQPADPAPWRP